MPLDAQDPTLEPKESDTSNEPFMLAMEDSCLVWSGLETASTVICDWLALKSLTIFCSAAASLPVHRYENVMVVLPEVPEPEPLALHPDMARASAAALAVSAVAARWRRIL